MASEELLDIERILAKGNVDEARRRLRQAANTEKLREEQRAAKVLPAPNLKAQGQSPKRKYLAFQPKAEGELISGAEYRARAQADDAKKQQAAEEKKQKKEKREKKAEEKKLEKAEKAKGKDTGSKSQRTTSPSRKKKENEETVQSDDDDIPITRLSRRPAPLSSE